MVWRVSQDENNPCSKPFTACWPTMDWKSLLKIGVAIKSELLANASQSDQFSGTEGSQLGWIIPNIKISFSFGFCAFLNNGTTQWNLIKYFTAYTTLTKLKTFQIVYEN